MTDSVEHLRADLQDFADAVRLELHTVHLQWQTVHGVLGMDQDASMESLLTLRGSTR